MTVSMIASIIIILVVFLIISGLCVIFYIARYKKVPPGNVMLVYGAGTNGPGGFAVVASGGKFILPIIQSYAFLSVGLNVLEIRMRRIPSIHRRADTLSDVIYRTHYRIDPKGPNIAKAAQLFLNADKKVIDSTVAGAVEQEIKKIFSALSLEEIMKGTIIISEQIKRQSQEELDRSGLEIRTLEILDIIPERIEGELGLMST